MPSNDSRFSFGNSLLSKSISISWRIWKTDSRWFWSFRSTTSPNLPVMVWWSISVSQSFKVSIFNWNLKFRACQNTFACIDIPQQIRELLNERDQNNNQNVDKTCEDQLTAAGNQAGNKYSYDEIFSSRINVDGKYDGSTFLFVSILFRMRKRFLTVSLSYYYRYDWSKWENLWSHAKMSR